MSSLTYLSIRTSIEDSFFRYLFMQSTSWLRNIAMQMQNIMQCINFINFMFILKLYIFNCWNKFIHQLYTFTNLAHGSNYVFNGPTWKVSELLIMPNCQHSNGKIHVKLEATILKYFVQNNWKHFASDRMMSNKDIPSNNST